ncbi:DUF6029 family protein [Lacinutrix venerupis]|uniref:DUF5723 domain-containing protein n=1 Tax=Lacinutrix venerupis TaxID=1486034 RepID=A0AAC9PXK0_9FLAO|nr:DUF6029 family protein [Lacinutrix venerupis]APY01181.1 hypothetical protein BWR22_12975 [Lacinutrix venerupis]
MKKIAIFLVLLLPMLNFSQEIDTEENNTIFKEFLNNLSGNLESNAQWYTNDAVLGDFEDPNPDFELRDEHVRVNSYLRLDYSFLDNFTVGLQVESYEPLPLINYYPEYNDTQIATYYANYRNKTLDVTAGYFYEQFGSGLLLRAFEERQLGLNTALRGGRIKYNPTEYLDVTALYGQQRVAFDVSESDIFGFYTNFDFAKAFEIKGFSRLNLGLSYVGKKEDFTPPVDEFDPTNEFDTTDFPEMINSYSARLDVDFGNVYFKTEYALKGEDVSYIPPALPGTGIIEGKYFDGNALLFTAGYSKKGLGVSNTFRRMENMIFTAEREAKNISSTEFQFNMQNVNYLPTLTKQQDYSLANIYIYNTQPGLFLQNFGGQAGEIGNTLDVFYNFKKGSLLGGKYGTKFTMNFSYWALLEAEFDQAESTYEAEFLKFGKRLNRDINFEVRKRFSKNWSSIFTYVNTIVDKGVALGGNLGTDGDIKSQVAIADVTHKLGNGKSIRIEAQHLWTKDDKKNWAGGTLEYVASRKLAFYVTDIYNYGNDIEEDQNHYYNIGGSFTKGATRVALNYGRQRGGLLCVGGVCRFVPENTGLTLNLSTSF